MAEFFESREVAEVLKGHPYDTGIELILSGGMGSLSMGSEVISKEEILQRVAGGNTNLLEWLYTPCGLLIPNPKTLEEINQQRAQTAYLLGSSFPFLDFGQLDLDPSYTIGLKRNQIDETTRRSGFNIEFYTLQAQGNQYQHAIVPNFLSERSLRPNYEPVFTWTVSEAQDHATLSVKPELRP